MRCDKIIKIIEDWAPKSIAWEKDNVGLQVGSLHREVKNILLCLDVDEKVVDEATRKNCNLVISHHPLLFRSLKKLDVVNDKKSRIIEKLIKKDITLYSAHTNLDFTKDGVSFQLAKKLKLANQKFLVNLSQNQNKLVVFVPITYANKVADAMHNAGAGMIGEYTNCSFRTLGTGTFKGSERSNPKVGLKGNIERVEEVKIEVLVSSFDVNKVVTAMKQVHPYEEIAYDVYPLANENVNYGMGVIGELENELSQKDFLYLVVKSLKTKNLRFTKGSRSKIKNVAVCGGSGSDLLDAAINNNADAFVTADVKYHTFQDAEKGILLIDAGHYETEVPVLDEIKNRLEKSLIDKTKVYKYTGSTNPIVFIITKEPEKLYNRLKVLYQLQLVDDQLDKLEELRGDLPNMVRSLESKINELNTEIETKTNEQKESVERRSQNEEEIEKLKESQKKFKAQLYQVRNNKEYDALTKEIDHSEEQITKLTAENDALADSSKGLSQQVEDIKPKLDELLAELSERQADLKEIVKANEVEETKLLSDRKHIEEQVKKPDLSVYMRIRKAKKGKAVSTIKRSACSGCHNIVPSQRQLEIRRNARIFTCEYCGRILISQEIADEVDGTN